MLLIYLLKIKINKMDIKLKCIERGKEFILTENEQLYFKKLLKEGRIKSYNQPKRCLECRKNKKKNNENEFQR
jgi:hypothetical protein